jgi:SAM-dependent methyltransferase
MNEHSKAHWERVYARKATTAVSWFQEQAATSLRLIQSAGLPLEASILDVGGGASVLVDDLLAVGYRALTVLDLSGAALAAARARLGARAEPVRWIEGDSTRVDLPAAAFELWHDRAVFHFLTDPEDRQAYMRQLEHALKPGGHLIIATFAEDGPERCSELPVMRYSASELQAEIGAGYVLLHSEKEAHQTPGGALQSFTYCHFHKVTP